MRRLRSSARVASTTCDETPSRATRWWTSFDSTLQSSGQSRDQEGGQRVLVFHSSPLAIEVELQFDRIVGQIVPPGGGEITLEAADGTQVRVDADDLGFFILPRASEGAIRLRCETPTTRLVTDWFQP
jgi:hypothetical protein